jgi:hypothetical protein
MSSYPIKIPSQANQNITNLSVQIREICEQYFTSLTLSIHLIQENFRN